MYKRVFSGTISGIDAQLVNVEADVSVGLPCFEMTGFLSAEVKEARDRVRIAVKNSEFKLNPHRIVINISPADIRKSGTGFDLPIAIAILAADGQIECSMLDKTLILGELSLDGTVKGVRGVLPNICMAKELGITNCIIPYENYAEGLIVEEVNIIPVKTLREVIDFLENGAIPTQKYKIAKEYNNESELDFCDVKGQKTAKRASLIAVAGMHNLCLIGPPGAGKTMIAKRIPTIMPNMDYEDKLKVTKIHSVAGLMYTGQGLIHNRPFRSPYHNISKAAFMGGGSYPTPGEMTLASKGVLFLDEMTEFKSEILESMRQPLEDKYIRIVRVNNSCIFPTDFMLVGAMNPCKCGYYPDRNKCNCSENEIKRYIGRISKPLWDRFDLSIQVDNMKYEEINNTEKDLDYTTENMRERVEKVRLIQKERFVKSRVNFNSEIDSRDIERYCNLGAKEKSIMKNVFEKMNLTARGYHKILKVARTIADLEKSEEIREEHLYEAIIYRNINCK